MSEGQYELVADLLRFIVPPGADNLLVGLPRLTQAAEPPGAEVTTQQPRQVNFRHVYMNQHGFVALTR